MADDVMTLQEAADDLGVHYMTAYRYVRLGQLDAHKEGGGWRVTRHALDEFRGARDDRDGAADGRGHSAPWSARLESRLMAGDAAGSWGVVEAAMSAGTDVADIYTTVLTPAMWSIGDRWASGEIDVAVEHRASGIAIRLVGRLGSRCVRRGRSRGTVVLGAPEGERHSLVVAILADLLRLEGWDVSDLGADTPAASFALAASDVDDLAAVGLSVTHADNLERCAATCALLHDAELGVPILVGGLAIRDRDHARSLGADEYAPDADSMVTVLDRLTGSAA